MYDRGMAQPQLDYRQDQRADYELKNTQAEKQQKRQILKAGYIRYAKDEQLAGRVPMAAREWLYKEQESSTGSSNVAKTWTGSDGNLWYLQRDGAPKNTGIKGSPGAFEVTTEGGVAYAKQTLPGGEVKMTPLDKFAQEYRTGALEQEKYADSRGANWAKKDSVFEDFVMTGAPLLQARVTDLRDIKARLDDGSLATGIQRGGPLAALFDPDAGEASVVSMLETLKAVSEYGLTPVSDTDVDNIKAMFVDFWATGEVNSVKLGAAIEKMEAVIRDTELKARYFYDDGYQTLKGYNNKNRPRFDIGDGYTGASTNSGSAGSTNEVTVVRTRKAD
jgi:hypothetical protein